MLNDVPVRLAGAASGVFNTAQALAVAFGAAVVGTVYTSVGESSGLESAYRASLVVMIGFVVVGGLIAQALRTSTTTSEATDLEPAVA
ncbi:Uncharacterised protein [Mycobacteroides abscessus subsp. abscessus]|nr:Uncharacterised protein [Mycobacteroides abscessus subsp. abscessus]